MKNIFLIYFYRIMPKILKKNTAILQVPEKVINDKNKLINSTTNKGDLKKDTIKIQTGKTLKIVSKGTSIEQQKETKPKVKKETKPKPIKETKPKPVKEIKPKVKKETKPKPVKETKLKLITIYSQGKKGEKLFYEIRDTIDNATGSLRQLESQSLFSEANDYIERGLSEDIWGWHPDFSDKVFKDNFKNNHLIRLNKKYKDHSERHFDLLFEFIEDASYRNFDTALEESRFGQAKPHYIPPLFSLYLNKKLKEKMYLKDILKLFWEDYWDNGIQDIMIAYVQSLSFTIERFINDVLPEIEDIIKEYKLPYIVQIV